MELLLNNKTEVLNEIITRMEHMESRERIVIAMPFACKIKRVEIYMSETATNRMSAGAMISGEPFNYMVTVSVYANHDNKVSEKSSYSYKREFFEYLPILIGKLHKIL